MNALAPFSWRIALLLGLIGAGCFHAAYTPAKSGLLALLIIGYVVSLVQLARLRTTRQCFYAGLAMGFACFAPQLECFWRIFGPGAIALWLILAFWTGLFVALAHLALVRLSPQRAAVLIPFLWTGLEYFRSELYYLKFSWLNVGYAFSDWPNVLFELLGIYGWGFAVVFLCPAIRQFFTRQLSRWQEVGFILIMLWILASLLLPRVITFGSRAPNLVVAGVQLEFPDENEIYRALDKLVAAPTNLPSQIPRAITNVDLVVLSEYTLDGPPPERLKDWCRRHQKFLIVGGKDPAPGNDYYNTAFVISTNGEIVFKQVKSVPIQFFKDGRPALEQKVWDSPWGKIGICICYDLCYSRVTDELVRQGAQMLIVPTMDVVDWGRHQHELHARVAPVRAAEYGIPIFRLASSGISQGVNRRGREHVRASFAGEGEMIFFATTLGRPGSLPVDRWLAPLSVAVTGLFVVGLAIDGVRRKRLAKRES